MKLQFYVERTAVGDCFEANILEGQLCEVCKTHSILADGGVLSTEVLTAEGSAVEQSKGYLGMTQSQYAEVAKRDDEVADQVHFDSAVASTAVAKFMGWVKR